MWIDPLIVFSCSSPARFHPPFAPFLLPFLMSDEAIASSRIDQGWERAKRTTKRRGWQVQGNKKHGRKKEKAKAPPHHDDTVASLLNIIKRIMSYRILHFSHAQFWSQSYIPQKRKKKQWKRGREGFLGIKKIKKRWRKRKKESLR